MKRTNNSGSAAALQPRSKPEIYPQKRNTLGLPKYSLYYLMVPLVALHIYKMTTRVYIHGAFTNARATQVVRDRSAFSEEAQMGWNQVTEILAALPKDGNVSRIAPASAIQRRPNSI
jgi:hypothetical protein